MPEGHHPRFSPDGRWLMYWAGPTGSTYARLLVRPLSGGAPTQIGAGATAACGVGTPTAAWSPDGSRVLFSGGDCFNAAWNGWVSTLDAKDLKPAPEINSGDHRGPRKG